MVAIRIAEIMEKRYMIMKNNSGYSDVLGALSIGTIGLDLLEKELALPNIPFPVMPDFIAWTTVAESGGWKLQQNMITRHARIVDENDIRIAWGTINGMEKAMDRLVRNLNKYKKTADLNEFKVSDSTQNYNETINKLKKLKELLDCGVLTQDEYDTKKADLLNQI